MKRHSERVDRTITWAVGHESLGKTTSPAKHITATGWLFLYYSYLNAFVHLPSKNNENLILLGQNILLYFSFNWDIVEGYEVENIAMLLQKSRLPLMTGLHSNTPVFLYQPTAPLT